MSSQIAVRSIDALKDLRVALALYGEDTLGALGGVGAEIRRTAYWLNQERPAFWQDQIKRRRERVATAKAEVFRKQLSKTPGGSVSMTEQLENLRRAEASLEDAEKRLALTRKWQAQFHQAVLEYHGTIRRIKSLAAGEIPSGVNLLTRLIDSLEAYIAVAVPTLSGTLDPSAAATPPAAFESIAVTMIEAEPPAAVPTDDEAVDEPLLDDEDDSAEPESAP